MKRARIERRVFPARIAVWLTKRQPQHHHCEARRDLAIVKLAPRSFFASRCVASRGEDAPISSSSPELQRRAETLRD
jgi:hypothetical protein